MTDKEITMSKTYVQLGKDGAIGELVQRREVNPITSEVIVRTYIYPVPLYRIDVVKSGLAEVIKQLEQIAE